MLELLLEDDDDDEAGLWTLEDITLPCPPRLADTLLLMAPRSSPPVPDLPRGAAETIEKLNIF